MCSFEIKAMKINKSGCPNFLSWLSAGNQRTVPTKDHKYFTVYPFSKILHCNFILKVVYSFFIEHIICREQYFSGA